MSPADKHIDPEMLALALKKCNGSWLQRTILGALIANIGVVVYGIGTFMVNNRLLQDSLNDIRDIKINYHRMDKEIAQTVTTVQGHEVRIISLERENKPRN